MIEYQAILASRFLQGIAKDVYADSKNAVGSAALPAIARVPRREALEVRERLGHAKTDLVNNVYGHVLPTMQSEAAEKLNRLLG
jgi:hypothetical protein